MEYLSEKMPPQPMADKAPEIQMALQTLRELNDTEEEILHSVKERLRGILKWEQPPTPASPQTEPVIESAIDEFKYQLQRKDKLNQRLSDCLLHLKQII